MSAHLGKKTSKSFQGNESAYGKGYTLLACPNHNLPFEMLMDASNYQLSAVIMQNCKLVANYLQKLNAA
jgi:hypothetical protein